VNEPGWAEIQKKGAIASYVVPLAVGLVRPNDEHPGRLSTVEGTGFLIAGGRGVGVTAKHVARNLLKKAPIPEYSVPVAVDAQVNVPLVMFIEDSGSYRTSPVLAAAFHPSEDVALFRLPDQDLYSPYSFTPHHHVASAEYAIWGYPDEVRYDFFAEGQTPLYAPLIFSGGYIRRRLSIHMPPPGPLGHSFYELTNPAGMCCSGAPLSIRRDPWRAIGVYVGERRQPESGLAVGFATRAEALVEHWPELFDPTADLSGLCPLPPESTTGDVEPT
jgi:hypothetical protein